MKTGFQNYVVSKNKDEVFMTEAISVADLAKSRGDTPIGAVLALPSRRLSDCTTVFSEGNLMNHAEVNVIKKATELGFRKLKDAVLYSTVEPCPMCAMIAYEHGIREFVFGAYDIKGFCTSKIINLEALPIVYRGGILAKECRDILPQRLQEQTRENNESV